MTRQEIVQIIHDVLQHHIKLPATALVAFHEDARLNEDLYMDSIMILQMILHLEVDLGFEIPDEMLVSKDFRTVGSLVDFLLHQQKPATAKGGIQ
ncbi:acyl carrier protein [Bacillus sp. LL01]|uniref:petrobactin biosynthesis protein AsbD n=1 Tax=Bacillus sp. LL01 TaxID=1665556 RepID=UPI00064D3BD9|nr:petrobactin biosynthesis protein AsbD [Bacillus sp. LL01]KMJ57144.1 acyl carrier protein [Bacillus sp. LL01]